jgi:hypothetical protein
MTLEEFLDKVGSEPILGAMARLRMFYGSGRWQTDGGAWPR